MAGRLAAAMSPQGLEKSALLGAFCFYLVLFFGFDIQPDLLWWLRQPLNAMVLIIVSPALEEWIFRGWLFDLVRNWSQTLKQELLSERLLSIQNAVTTSCFCALHSVLRDPLTGLLVLGPSLLLGFMRDRQVSLPVLMMIHGVWNAGWFFFYPPG
jgi:membrane protease YdiL (CAAX protease family)